MLISIKELKEIYSDKDFSKFSDKRLEMKLKSIELSIRKYCNNTFEDRNNRHLFSSVGGVLVGNHDMRLNVGDTVLISQSKCNNGLYVVKAIESDKITLDSDLYNTDINLVTKVGYPLDIIDGAIDLLDWAMNKSDKADITSETISRHSVSYQNLDSTNTIDGFPSRLFGFCKKYVKGRT